MNIERLRAAEAEFLLRYPGGFSDPEMAAVAKKHRVEQMCEATQSQLAKKQFATTSTVLDSIVKLTTRSSMVSMFEKPKFRDYVNGLAREDREVLADGFRKMLHGNQQRGFDQVVELLAEAKLAKWSLMTILPFYFRPTTDVFVKPTTTKNAIRFFELEGLEYKPRPSWAFYERYRETINEMKSRVDPSLSTSNAAFTGFLMAAMGTR